VKPHIKVVEPMEWLLDEDGRAVGLIEVIEITEEELKKLYPETR